MVCLVRAEGGLVNHRVQAKRGDQRDVMTSAVQPQFQDAVSRVSYELDGYRGKEAPRASLTICWARMPTVL